jgi:anti-sigma regulatory factor (Ser/Thr protein kinase)
MRPVPGPPPTIDLRLTLPCQLSEVRHAVRTVQEFLKQQHCAENELSACELALVEACNNAIQYAAVENQSKPVLIEVTCDPCHVFLRVTDHTPGFDWPAHPVFPEPERQGGRGIPLMDSLMDQVEYFRSAEANVLVMRKDRAKTPFSS